MEALSQRGKKLIEQEPFNVVFNKCMENPYNPETGAGVINCGVAENVLAADVMLGMFKKIDKEFVEKDESILHVPSDFNYCDFSGIDVFRKNLMAFYKRRVFGFDWKDAHDDDFCLVNGAGTAVETVCSIVANEGEYVLLPAPNYHSFENDMKKRFGVLPISFPLKKIQDPEDKLLFEYKVDIDALNQCYENLPNEKKSKVRALIFTNPHNPSGSVFDLEECLEVLKWCMSKKLHFISDEVYANSVFVGKDKQNGCNSIFLGLNKHNLLNEQFVKERVHHIYSFSKDFGLNGFRMGVVFSKNSYLMDAIKSTSYFTGVSSYPQRLMANVLEPKNVPQMDAYLEENSKRLTERWQLCSKILHEHGIPHSNSKSAMFCWFNLLHDVDLKKYDEEKIKTIEIELWKFLVEKMDVNVLPGQFFDKSNKYSAGMFRMCMSCYADKKVIVEGLRRILDGAKKFKESM